MIFDFGDVKAKDCVAGNGGKGNEPCLNLLDVQVPFSLRSLCFVSMRQFFFQLAFLERAGGLAENCLRGWGFWIKLADFTGPSVLQRLPQTGW